VAYINGRLTMEWASPDACPRSRSPSGTGSGGGGSDGSGSGRTSRGIGFWGFIKFLFYGALIGLVAYFALGEADPTVKGRNAEIAPQGCSITTSNTLPKGGTLYPTEISGESSQPSSPIYSDTSMRMCVHPAEGAVEVAAEVDIAVWDDQGVNGDMHHITPSVQDRQLMDIALHGSLESVLIVHLSFPHLRPVGSLLRNFPIARESRGGGNIPVLQWHVSSLLHFHPLCADPEVEAAAKVEPAVWDGQQGMHHTTPSAQDHSYRYRPPLISGKLTPSPPTASRFATNP